jgi:hypothetical protein
MPEKTADDLARILSLSSSSAPRASARPDETPAPGSATREFSPGLVNTLFYDFGTPGSPDPASTISARPRFNSKVYTPPSPSA